MLGFDPVGFALFAGALAKGELPAGGFEAPRVVSAEEVLTLSARIGPGYEIADEVEADGFSQHFTLVTRDFGDIPATSDFMVAIRIEEMNALIALQKVSEGQAYGKAVAKSGAAPARLLKNLITQPVDTLISSDANHG